MPVIQARNISKQYRLGSVGTGTLSHDLNRWWHRVRGKPDPYLKVTESNDRAHKGSTDYVWALRNISFDVEQGEVLGIIGRNGAGKSTLLKILSRVTAPTTGHIGVRGRIGSLLEVGTGFHPELTGRENIFLNGAILGMTKPEIQAKLDEIVDFSGCERYIDTPVKRYSSGMMVRLGFAVAAHLEPEILIIDEVLAVGDAEFQRKCVGKMKDVAEHGRTVLFVSHNMESIVNLCSRTMVVDGGMISSQGPTREAVRAYLAAFSAGREGSPAAPLEKRGGIVADILSAGLQTKNDQIISCGDDLVITLTIDCKRPVKRPVLYVGLSDSFGREIFNMQSRASGQQFQAWREERRRVLCTVPRLPLVPGNYRIDAALLDDTEMLCLVRGLQHFEVHTGDFYGSGSLGSSVKGVALLDPVWSESSDEMKANKKDVRSEVC